MARFDRMTVLNTIIADCLVPVFYTGDLEIARKILAACAEGGAHAIEFTNRGDRAWQVFSELTAWAEKAYPQVMLGVGSIVDAPTAAMYISAGANFVVGPILNAEVARLCNRRKIAYCPGCGSATEISAAEELGVEIVKVFPGGQVGGPAFVKAVRGPMPWTRIMPTGSVDAGSKDNVQEWVRAGVSGLGIGSKLIRKDWVAAGNFEAIRDNVAQVLAWIKEARQA